MSTDSGPFSGRKKLDASLDTDGYGIWMDAASGFPWIIKDICGFTITRRTKSQVLQEETICKSELHCSRSLSKLKESFSRSCAKTPLSMGNRVNNMTKSKSLLLRSILAPSTTLGHQCGFHVHRDDAILWIATYVRSFRELGELHVSVLFHS